MGWNGIDMDQTKYDLKDKENWGDGKTGRICEVKGQERQDELSAND